MSSVNRVILVGHLGRDPELRFYADGTPMTRISLATSETRKGPNGEKQARTEWHRISFFGKTAETAAEYLKKGALIYVEGRIQTRKWLDADGQARSGIEIVGERMQMLGRADRHDADAEFESVDVAMVNARAGRLGAAANDARPAPAEPAGGNASAESARERRRSGAHADELESELPF